MGSKHVTYADITLRSFYDKLKIIIDTECISDDKLIYCLTCNAVIVSSKENSHTKFHDTVYDLEQRLGELEKRS